MYAGNEEHEESARTVERCGVLDSWVLPGAGGLQDARIPSKVSGCPGEGDETRATSSGPSPQPNGPGPAQHPVMSGATQAPILGLSWGQWHQLQ